MSASKLHTLGGVSLFPDDLTAEVKLGGIVRQSIRSGADVRQEPTSGQAYPMFQALYAVKPMASFATRHVATALKAVGTMGLRISAIDTETRTGLKYYGTQKKEGGTRTTGSTHVAWGTTEGILVPRRVQCSHQGDAELDLENLITYDGTNEPLVKADNVTLPTIADTERYTLGKIVLGTSGADTITLTQKTDVEIDFGLDAVTVGADSDLFDTMAVINAVMRAMITIRLLDVTLLKTSSGIPLTGANVSYAVSKIYFRKRGKTATGFVADNTAEHICITPAYGLAIQDSIFDASQVENGQATIQIPLIGDASLVPLAVDTEAAIT